VAVVSYNSEEIMEGTLLSILEQDYPNMEIVVVDGESKDATMEIVKKYSDFIDVIISEKDSGPYDAMNKAALNGTGDYIIYINSGDYFHDKKSISNAMSNIGLNGKLKKELPDFITGNHIYVHVDGATAYQKAQQFDNTWEALQLGVMGNEWWSGIPCHQATFTKRQLIADKKYDLDFKIAADHNFMFTNRSEGAKFVHCNSTVGVYVGGGLSAIEGARCAQESWKIAEKFGQDNPKVKDYYEKFFGIENILDITPETRGVVAEARSSGLFWEDWYRLNCLPKKYEAMDPILHYFVVGKYEEAKPNPFFDASHYYVRNQDVKKEEHDAFMHYIRSGRYQLRPTMDWDDAMVSERFLKVIFDWTQRPIDEIDASLLEMDDKLLAYLVSAID
jgi:glycosyltransferase involved in cell wall biosynthesis